MGWIYRDTMVEDPSRYSAPPDVPSEAEPEIPPYDLGYEDRVCCRERKPPAYYYATATAEWLRGWDAADQEFEDESPT